MFSKAMTNLKSNMDRFIGPVQEQVGEKVVDLKSNMDRFIGRGIKG